MRSVVICTSKRFKDEAHNFAQELEKLGVTVYEPDFRQVMPEDISFDSDHVKELVFTGLTLKHFDWIRKADVCFIYNKDNYIGKSVTLEMGFATGQDKPIYALTGETGDPCPNILIDKVAATPQELATLLA